MKEFFDLSVSNNYKVEEPIFSHDVYKCQIRIESDLIISGAGVSKVEAREDAAKKTFLFLAKEKAGNYSPLLQLFLMLEGLDRCEFNNITSGRTFMYQVWDGENMVGEGAGLTETEAKENAAHKAYFHLIQIEENKAKDRERFKRGERLQPLTSKTTIPEKQKNRESSLTQVPVSKQSSSKQVVESTIHKKPVKHSGKAAQSQEQTKPNIHRNKPPVPKLPPAARSPSRGLSKPPKKSAASNQTSVKQVKRGTSSKNTVMKQPRSLVKSEEPFPDNLDLGQ